MEQDYTGQYEDFELRHWWFVSRRAIIHSALDRVVDVLPSPRWLDIGCGTGVLLDSYERIPPQRKLGVEMDADCVERARRKGLDVWRTQPDAWDFDELGSFDLVTLCDVLEHVEDEEAAIKQVHRRLAPGGMTLVTVPALKGLWSDHDVVNHHFRRYHRPELLALFDPQQWDVLQASYFCSMLLGPIWLIRKAKNLRRRLTGENRQGIEHDFRFGPRLMDRTLQGLFGLERHWLSRGRTLPAGSSLMLLAAKRPDPVPALPASPVAVSSTTKADAALAR